MALDPKMMTNATSNARAGEAPQIFSVWITDTMATAQVSGYFNAKAKSLERGDLIHLIRLNSSGLPVEYGLAVVRSKSSAGVVDVSNVANKVTLADTD